MPKKLLFLFALLLCASARACDYETVLISEGYYVERFVPPVYAYTSCGATYVAVTAHTERYWVPPRYVYRPVVRVVYAPIYAPIYAPVIYNQPFRPFYRPFWRTGFGCW